MSSPTRRNDIAIRPSRRAFLQVAGTYDSLRVDSEVVKLRSGLGGISSFRVLLVSLISQPGLRPGRGIVLVELAKVEARKMFPAHEAFRAARFLEQSHRTPLADRRVVTRIETRVDRRVHADPTNAFLFHYIMGCVNFLHGFQRVGRTALVWME